MKNAMIAAPARQMAVPTILATLLKLLISTFSSLRAGSKAGVRIWAATGEALGCSFFHFNRANWAHKGNKPICKESVLAQ